MTAFKHSKFTIWSDFSRFLRDYLYTAYVRRAVI